MNSHPRLSRVLSIRWLLALVLSCSLAPLRAQEEAAATSGALRDSLWYDAESDSVVPIKVKPVVDDSMNRDSRWLPKAKRVRQRNSQQSANNQAGGGGGGTGTGTGLFGSSLSIGNVFGWMLLLVIFIGGVALLVYVFSRAEIDLVPARSSSERGRKKDDAPDQQTIERMKHLPAELRRTDVNMRTEAERLMNEGIYEQAIILLFGHQLLLLDRAGMLRLNRGKTNGKYVRETRAADPKVATLLRSTVTRVRKLLFWSPRDPAT